MDDFPHSSCWRSWVIVYNVTMTASTISGLIISALGDFGIVAMAILASALAIIVSIIVVKFGIGAMRFSAGERRVWAGDTFYGSMNGKFGRHKSSSF